MLQCFDFLILSFTCHLLIVVPIWRTTCPDELFGYAEIAIQERQANDCFPLVIFRKMSCVITASRDDQCGGGGALTVVNFYMFLSIPSF